MAKSVLFVDDDLCVLQALLRRMRKEPFELRSATSAEEALGILSRSRIDLVVSDLNMPGMSGAEFLARVAKEYPRCIRIMLTGQPSLDVALSAINNGEVYRFVTKPYDSEALATMIRDALDQVEAAPATAAGARANVPATANSTASPPREGSVRPMAGSRAFACGVGEGGPGSEPGAQLSRALFEELAESGFLQRPGPKPRIQQYAVESVIGKGAMGVVLRARDTNLGRLVALKIMAPELADNEIAHQRFAQEARYAAAIRHENVVTIFTVSDLDGVPFLVMEYVPGSSVEERFAAKHKFAIGDVVRIGRQVAAGLAAAHELRLIHRDIKPANILLEESTGRVRITDFGLARAVDCDKRLSKLGVLLGTPLYMSPEQVDGKPLTPATDLFSLGSVLYTLCAGQRPFSANTLPRLLNAIMETTPAPLRELNPAVPEWLADLIGKLHAKKPEDRPTAASIVERLGREQQKAT